MKPQFKLHIDAWSHGARIPAKYAFGQPGSDGPFALSANVSPALRWENAPRDAVLCTYLQRSRRPSSAEDVNQAGKLFQPTLLASDFPGIA